MRSIKYILVDEKGNESAVRAIRDSRVSDFRHSHIVSTAGLTHPELVNLLLFARKQWPSAKILGISEVFPEALNLKPETRGRIRVSDTMNALRRVE